MKRLALLANRRLGVERPLSNLIAQRFERLAIMKLATATLLSFTRDRVSPVLGGDAAGRTGLAAGGTLRRDVCERPAGTRDAAVATKDC